MTKAEAERLEERREDLLYYVQLYMKYAIKYHKQGKQQKSWHALLNWTELNHRYQEGNK